MRTAVRAGGLMVSAVLAFAACSTPNPAPPALSSGASPADSPSPSRSPTASLRPSTSAAASASVDPADLRSGQKAIEGFLTGVNTAAGAKSDSAVKGTWQPSCIWCAETVQPIQMAAFAGNWSLTPARVSDPHVAFARQGVDGQLVYHVRMSVSAMKLTDRSRKVQRSSDAVKDGAYDFAAARVGGTWQVVQGVQGTIPVANK